MSIRNIIMGRSTADGAGVKLRRSIGATPQTRMDPFLMLDEFYSDHPDDYIAGFPSHPHRGFETITYMLEGRMRHEDHLGNSGLLETGGVQWMTAGRGIIHSEMPEQDAGRMRGFQIWLNLPAADKMVPANYTDIPAESFGLLELPTGGHIKVIAGQAKVNEQHANGAINPDGKKHTDPQVWDIHLVADETLTFTPPAHLQGGFYLYEGSAHLGDSALPIRSVAILEQGHSLTLQAGEQDARILYLAGKPLQEPIAQYGPFVMNTEEEIVQAIQDYQAGRLTK